MNLPPSNPFGPGAGFHRRAISRRTLLTGLAAGLTATVLPGCTAVPTGGDPEEVRQVLDQTAVPGQNQVQAGLSQDQVVRKFIEANARADIDPLLAAARAYLTLGTQGQWPNVISNGITLINQNFRTTPEGANQDVVQINGQVEGRIQADGAYLTLAEPEEFKATWRLAQVAGEWRIQTADAGLVMTLPDFTKAYRQLAVYFLDHTRTVVVPDLRYLPNVSDPLARARVLVNRLLAGPSEQLAGAARTEFGSGVVLRDNVTSSDSGVVVNLAREGALNSQQLQALSAQLVFTLNPQVASKVEISIDGVVQPDQTRVTLGSFDPDQVPTAAGVYSSQAYFVVDGRVKELGGQEMPGMVGLGNLDITMAAMSAANGSLAAIRTLGGESTVFTGRPLAGEGPVIALTAETVTLPSFNRSGDEIWTVRNGLDKPEVIRVSLGTELRNSALARVPSKDLADKGPVTALALSPDGVRVAVVADARLWLGVIEYTEDPADQGVVGAVPGGVATITQLRLLQPELTDVMPVTWLDAQNLLVGARLAKPYRSIWRLAVDGRQRTEIGSDELFADVESISYVPGKPLLASFDMSTGFRIWQRDLGESAGTWTQPAVPLLDQTGDWPFYPR